jgi:hypothetical protein
MSITRWWLVGSNPIGHQTFRKPRIKPLAGCELFRDSAISLADCPRGAGG